MQTGLIAVPMFLEGSLNGDQVVLRRRASTVPSCKAGSCLPWSLGGPRPWWEVAEKVVVEDFGHLARCCFDGESLTPLFEEG